MPVRAAPAGNVASILPDAGHSSTIRSTIARLQSRNRNHARPRGSFADRTPNAFRRRLFVSAALYPAAGVRIDFEDEFEGDYEPQTANSALLAPACPIDVGSRRLPDFPGHVAFRFYVLGREPREIADEIVKDENLAIAS